MRSTPRSPPYRHIRTRTAAMGTSARSSPLTPAFNFANSVVGSVLGHGPRLTTAWRAVVEVECFPPPLEQPATISAALTTHAPNTRPFADITSSMTLREPCRFLGRSRCSFVARRVAWPVGTRAGPRRVGARKVEQVAPSKGGASKGWRHRLPRRVSEGYRPARSCEPEPTAQVRVLALFTVERCLWALAQIVISVGTSW
jgi:hypothetical protein